MLPPACAAHARDRVLGAEQDALDVDRLHLVPLGLGDFVGVPRAAGDAGVVDQHVDAAEAIGHLVDRTRDVGFAGDVHVPVAGLAAGTGDRIHQCQAFGVEAVEDRDRGAFPGQPQRAGVADADRAAGDDAGHALDAVQGRSPARMVSLPTTVLRRGLDRRQSRHEKGGREHAGGAGAIRRGQEAPLEVRGGQGRRPGLTARGLSRRAPLPRSRRRRSCASASSRRRRAWPRRGRRC